MDIQAEQVWRDVEAIRSRSPLVHNITNYVVMNNTANALLSLGASPVMAHATEEVEDMVGLAGALVVNIGTLSAGWVEAMHKAMRAAARRGTPVVFDPVGVGATGYRTAVARTLMRSAPPTVLRGNASEVLALMDAQSTTKGVDSTEGAAAAREAAVSLVETGVGAVAVTGETDVVVGPGEDMVIALGDPLMARVTGMGCTVSALCGAFLAVNPNPVQAAAHACAVMGIAGAIAGRDAKGPGSFQQALLDALYQLDERAVSDGLSA